MQFLPASLAQKLSINEKGQESVVLDAAQQKVLDDLINVTMIEKTLAAMHRSKQQAKAIKSQLEGQITEGTATIRFYSNDKFFSVNFLTRLLSTFEEEKNRMVKQRNGKKITEIEDQLRVLDNERGILEDSMVQLKNQFHIPVSNEEMAQMYKHGVSPADSLGLVRFSALHTKLGKLVGHYARLKQVQDNLQVSLQEQTLSFFMISSPHYFSGKAD